MPASNHRHCKGPSKHLHATKLVCEVWLDDEQPGEEGHLEEPAVTGSSHVAELMLQNNILLLALCSAQNLSAVMSSCLVHMQLIRIIQACSASPRMTAARAAQRKTASH